MFKHVSLHELSVVLILILHCNRFGVAHNLAAKHHFNPNKIGLHQKQIDLIIGFQLRKPFFYFEKTTNEWEGVQWEIVKLFANRNQMNINLVEFADFVACERLLK